MSSIDKYSVLSQVAASAKQPIRAYWHHILSVDLVPIGPGSGTTPLHEPIVDYC